MVQEATMPLLTHLFSTEKVPESLLPSKSTNFYISLSGGGGGGGATQSNRALNGRVVVALGTESVM